MPPSSLLHQFLQILIRNDSKVDDESVIIPLVAVYHILLPFHIRRNLD
jgi:hypothetical protein